MTPKLTIKNWFMTLLMCNEEKTVNEMWNKGKNILLDTTEKAIPKKKKKIVQRISGDTIESRKNENQSHSFMMMTLSIDVVSLIKLSFRFCINGIQLSS